LVTTIITTTIGKSVQNRNIDVTTFTNTNPAFKIYIGCRQHGDEQESEEAGNRLITHITNNQSLYSTLTIAVCKLQNPDGKALSQRETSQTIDMNRDHTLLSAPESKVIQSFLNTFKPDVWIDVHNFPPTAGFMTSVNKQFDCDVALDKCNNPATKRTLTTQQFKDLLNELRAENPSYTYEWYLQASESGTVRHSTEAPHDARNGGALRFNCLGFIMEGREARSDEVFATQEEITTAGQTAMLISLIKYLKNHSWLFITPPKKLAVGETVSLKSGTDEEENFTLKAYDNTSHTVSDYTFTNVDTTNKSTANTTAVTAYAVPSNLTKVITLLTDHGIIGADGKVTDKYEIEKLKFGSSTSTATATKSNKSDFTGYKIYRVIDDAAQGRFLNYFLEPLAEYGITEYTTELSLPIAANTNYSILRLTKNLNGQSVPCVPPSGCNKGCPLHCECYGK